MLSLRAPQVKLLDGPAFTHDSVAEFLNRAVEPPPAASLRNAVRLLQDIGAFEGDSENLTLLGRHLAALPLPPRVGKMLLYGVLFGCLDPILTISCCMAYRQALRPCSS
jgi:HrpA-like RNA helicase